MTKRSSIWDRALSDFRPEIIAQGEVAYAYNVLQESFFNLFKLALALERPDRFWSQTEFQSYPLTVWHVFQSDSQQRQLAITMLASLPTALDIKGGIERLQWAKQKTDKFAEWRNIIVHTPVSFWPRERKGDVVLVPGIGGVSTKPIQHSRLKLIKTLSFWKALRNDLLNLNDYVDRVLRQIWHREYERIHGPVLGAKRTWPGKPRLPCLRRIKIIEDQRTKATPTQSRRVRRRPSRK
jgi:hypothetical protein